MGRKNQSHWYMTGAGKAACGIRGDSRCFPAEPRLPVNKYNNAGLLS